MMQHRTIAICGAPYVGKQTIMRQLSILTHSPAQPSMYVEPTEPNSYLNISYRSWNLHFIARGGVYLEPEPLSFVSRGGMCRQFSP